MMRVLLLLLLSVVGLFGNELDLQTYFNINKNFTEDSVYANYEEKYIFDEGKNLVVRDEENKKATTISFLGNEIDVAGIIFEKKGKKYKKVTFGLGSNESYDNLIRHLIDLSGIKPKRTKYLVLKFKNAIVSVQHPDIDEEGSYIKYIFIEFK